jgi:hypothetical protein
MKIVKCFKLIIFLMFIMGYNSIKLNMTMKQDSDKVNESNENIIENNIPAEKII